MTASGGSFVRLTGVQEEGVCTCLPLAFRERSWSGLLGEALNLSACLLEDWMARLAESQDLQPHRLFSFMANHRARECRMFNCFQRLWVHGSRGGWEFLSHCQSHRPMSLPSPVCLGLCSEQKKCFCRAQVQDELSFLFFYFPFLFLFDFWTTRCTPQGLFLALDSGITLWDARD